jgi:hypothetical protein
MQSNEAIAQDRSMGVAAAPKRARRSLLQRMGSRLFTLLGVFGYFVDRKRWYLAPIVLLLLLAAIVLVITGGLSYVAPFVYTLF